MIAWCLTIGFAAGATVALLFFHGARQLRDDAVPPILRTAPPAEHYEGDCA